MKTIQDHIATLMTCYAEYSKAVQDVMAHEYESPEYNEAIGTRRFYGGWIREELDMLKQMGIDLERFEYINAN